MLFSWYVASFGNYDATYGSLGAAIGFMTWIWLSTIVVLLGGEINAELEHQTARDTTEGAEQPLGARGAKMAEHRRCEGMTTAAPVPKACFAEERGVAEASISIRAFLSRLPTSAVARARGALAKNDRLDARLIRGLGAGAARGNEACGRSRHELAPPHEHLPRKRTCSDRVETLSRVNA